jgi:hypothetical protein
MSEENKQEPDKELIFIYNADSGLSSGLKDYFHKAFRPSTYQCNLCAVTYGPLGQKRSWTNFTENLKIPVRFLHKDEFKEEFNKADAKFPSAYLNDNNGLKLIIAKEEMENVEEIVELKDLVYLKLAEFNI